jgi:hypothetical protein
VAVPSDRRTTVWVLLGGATIAALALGIFFAPPGLFSRSCSIETCPLGCCAADGHCIAGPNQIGENLVLRGEQCRPCKGHGVWMGNGCCNPATDFCVSTTAP